MLLRKFMAEELLFNEEETRIILKFIFKPTYHSHIETMVMTDRLRSSAQALLVEAIDASYAIGFIERLLKRMHPTKGAIPLIRSFGAKASAHWFKHAKPYDLRSIKVYEFVLDRISLNFGSYLSNGMLSKVIQKNQFHLISYKKPTGFHTQKLRVYG